MQLTTNGLSHFSNQQLSSGKMSQESCHRQITPSDVSLPDWLEKMRHSNQVIDLNQEKVTRFWRWDVKTGCHAPKWPQCGCIYGPQRKVAWRILDAQYFGVAQRRRRVFVVASARTDLDPQRYFLSSKACAGILRRAEARGRKLPDILQTSLSELAMIQT
ncbi:putative DNA methyltransferase [Escherichia coli]|nr:putative DNA methyltransferase [Escherichia coli]